MYLIPGFWIEPNPKDDAQDGDFYFSMCTQLNNNGNYCWQYPIWKNEQYHVVMSQDYYDIFKIDIDGENLRESIHLKVKNSNPMEYSDVTVYVSDPWSPGFHGCLLNFQVSK